MIEYKNLPLKQKKLFDELANAIEKNAKANDSAQDILKNANSKDIQAVLNTLLFCALGEQTLLIRAIKFNDTEIAEAILEKAAENQGVLTNLLSKESIINGNSRTAFEYAKEKGYTDLAKKIKAKMDKLGISDKKETLKKGNKGLVPSDNRDENFTIRRASNNLFWAVLLRKGEVVKNILKNSRNQGDTAQILKVGLIRLCIGDKRAEALATKGNDKIIRDIKTGQAFAISLIGLMMVVFTIAAIALIISTAPVPMTTAPIIGIVTAVAIGVAGFAGVGFAVFHDSYKILDTQVEKVGTDKTAQLLPKL